MSFYERLVLETTPDRLRLLNRRVIRDALRGEIRREQYLSFLEQAYHHVKHTVPLLMACGGRLPARLTWLRAAITEYIEEEAGHEAWILDDIRACGGDPATIKHREPPLEAEAMVARAYHQIDRLNPVGFFGMVHVLEGTSAAIATQAAAVIRDALRLPAQAMTYLTSHGSLDQEHVRAFQGLMDALTEEEDRAAVIRCARAIYHLYGNLFDSLATAENPA